MSLWSNYLFPCDFWVEDLSSPLWKKFENFSVLGVDFLFRSRKLNFGIWEGDFFFESGPSKGVNVLAIFRYVVKSRYFSEGEGKKEIFCFRVYFRKINILVENWKSVEKRGNLVCKFREKRCLWIFKEYLNDGNLWLLPFSLFNGFVF
jgi:hypothetical protein